MSVRLNKCVGYGFTDVVEDDPRIDWDQYEYAQEAKYSDFNTYFQMVKNRKDVEVMVHGMSTKADTFDNNKYMSQFVEYDNEFGDSNVMLFIHLDYPQWSRRGDDIDYYDHIITNSEPTTRLAPIPGGIYPFNQGPVKHIASGIMLDRDKFNVYKNTSIKMIIGNDVTVDFGDPNILDQFSSEVPTMIKHLATFFGVKEEYIPTLKSALYEYWS